MADGLNRSGGINGGHENAALYCHLCDGSVAHRRQRRLINFCIRALWTLQAGDLESLLQTGRCPRFARQSAKDVCMSPVVAVEADIRAVWTTSEADLGSSRASAF
jgi:hypothetical protein